MNYEQQVSKNHYSFLGYYNKMRWMSFWYQTKAVVERPDITTMLDVGAGTDFLRTLLSAHRPDVTYQTLDIAADLQPDVVGSVTSIPLPDNSFDAVSAFQVLEHIEFSDFEPALLEMKRVSKKYIFISLPHSAPTFDFQLKVPGFKRLSFYFRFPWHRKHVFKGQHYWEIGKKGYSAKKILAILEKHFTVMDQFSPMENLYHQFYILEK
jgi:ubiquinone/menaquinone biosynthesis C-methylase UbiE